MISELGVRLWGRVENLLPLRNCVWVRGPVTG